MNAEVDEAAVVEAEAVETVARAAVAEVAVTVEVRAADAAVVAVVAAGAAATEVAAPNTRMDSRATEPKKGETLGEAEKTALLDKLTTDGHHT